jgi:hypothetical protein
VSGCRWRLGRAAILPSELGGHATGFSSSQNDLAGMRGLIKNDASDRLASQRAALSGADLGANELTGRMSSRRIGGASQSGSGP